MAVLIENKTTPKASPRPFKFTVEILKKMYEAGILEPDVRIELIEGEPVMMAPIGFKHAKILERLQRQIYKILPDEFILWVQNPVKKDEENLIYPDLAIYSEKVYEKEDIPQIDEGELFVEVSDTTLLYDKEVKLPIYAEGRAKQVWIVDLNKEIVEVYLKPCKGLFKEVKIYQKDEKIPVFDKEVDLKEVF